MTKGQQGQGNCAYVRKLLQQKQPEFSAVLEFAVREVSIQLACGGSVDTAAKTLFCHPNTVRYRLNRVAGHTGRSLTDPRAVTELILALQADYLGRGRLMTVSLRGRRPRRGHPHTTSGTTPSFYCRIGVPVRSFAAATWAEWRIRA